MKVLLLVTWIVNNAANSYQIEFDSREKCDAARLALSGGDTRAAVTPDMALRLGKLCGNGPELWLALLRGEKAAEIDAIPTLRAA